MPTQRAKQTARTAIPQFHANQQQAAAIAHTDGPAAFIAAAGTGQTAILVQRLARLIAVERAKEDEIKAEQSADFFRQHLGIEHDLAERYQEFFVRYEQAKHKEKLYALSDLIYVPLGLLESSPTFRKNWQGRYQYLQ